MLFNYEIKKNHKYNSWHFYTPPMQKTEQVLFKQILETIS